METNVIINSNDIKNPVKRVASHPNEERVYLEANIEEDAFFITRLLLTAK